MLNFSFEKFGKCFVVESVQFINREKHVLKLSMPCAMPCPLLRTTLLKLFFSL